MFKETHGWLSETGKKNVKVGDGINANLVGKNGGRVVENARYDMYGDPLSRCQHNCSIQELH